METILSGNILKIVFQTNRNKYKMSFLLEKKGKLGQSKKCVPNTYIHFYRPHLLYSYYYRFLFFT